MKIASPRVTQVLKFFNEIQEKHAQLKEGLKHIETRLAQSTSFDDSRTLPTLPEQLVSAAT